MRTVVTKNYFYAVAAASTIVLSIAGCNKSSETAPTGSTPATSTGAGSPGAGQPAASDQGSSAAAKTQINTVSTTGKAVFDSNGCMRCHAISGQGGDSAPELTHVGAEAGHTRAWLAAHVKNPKTHNPRSTMPAFEGQISEKDLQALAAYLSSLK